MQLLPELNQTPDPPFNKREFPTLPRYLQILKSQDLRAQELDDLLLRPPIQPPDSHSHTQAHPLDTQSIHTS